MAKKQEMRRNENKQHTDAFKSQISLAHSPITGQQFSRNDQIRPTSKTTSEVMQFDLKHIPREYSNASELKKVFKKLHIVDADTKVNNITGEQLGEGKIRIRVPESMKGELNSAIEKL